MSLVGLVQDRIASAPSGFSDYERDFPEMRRDWWETRASRGPASDAPGAFGAFLMALGQAGAANATAEDFLRLENAIDELHKALTYHPEQKISKARAMLRGVAVAMHVKRTHANFIGALMNLRRQLSETPMYQAGRDAARQAQGFARYDDY